MGSAPLVRNQGGYSLLEASVALAVASTILLAANGALITGLQFRRQDETRFARQAQVRNAMDRLVRELREATNVAVGAGGAEISFTFRGQNSRYYLASGEFRRDRGATTQRIAGPLSSARFVQEGSGAVYVELASGAAREGQYRLATRVVPRVRP